MPDKATVKHVKLMKFDSVEDFKAKRLSGIVEIDRHGNKTVRPPTPEDVAEIPDVDYDELARQQAESGIVRGEVIFEFDKPQPKATEEGPQ